MGRASQFRNFFLFFLLNLFASDKAEPAAHDRRMAGQYRPPPAPFRHTRHALIPGAGAHALKGPDPMSVNGIGQDRSYTRFQNGPWSAADNRDTSGERIDMSTAMLR